LPEPTTYQGLVAESRACRTTVVFGRDPESSSRQIGSASFGGFGFSKIRRVATLPVRVAVAPYGVDAGALSVTTLLWTNRQSSCAAPHSFQARKMTSIGRCLVITPLSAVVRAVYSIRHRS
jgi:hypothetical protein